MVGPQVSQSTADTIDWVVIGLAGALFLISITSSVFAAAFSISPKGPVAQEFNYLWRARVTSQLLAAGYAVSLILRLQVLWGPHSQLVPGGYHPAVMCRAYVALAYGLFEPLFLLVCFFALYYSLKLHSRDAGMFGTHPNFNIVFLALGFSLPCCVAQLVAALFTRMFDLAYSQWLLGAFFSTFVSLPPYCVVLEGPAAPDGTQTTSESSSCSFCTFPLLSTLITAVFACCYLLMFLWVTHRMAHALINKYLVRRAWALQLAVTALFTLSIISRGTTVIFEPFDLGFELLRLATAVCSVSLVLTVSFVLVIKPLWDARLADKIIKKHNRTAVAGPPRAPSSNERQECEAEANLPVQVTGGGLAREGSGRVAELLPLVVLKKPVEEEA